MGFTAAVANGMLDDLDTSATHVSLHTADPSTTGTAEVVGGSYARQALTWAAASGGTKSNSAQAVFNVPAGTTITHVGLWNASTSGTFAGGGALGASQVYPTAGTFTISAGDLDASV